MDHTSFEATMIDYVNRNAKAEEEIRNENLRDAREARANARRSKRTAATIEAMAWIAGFICIVAIMAWGAWMAFVPAELAIAICSMFGFIAGIRVNTLAILIKKYGGR